jgi:hypothetical protein
MTVESLRPASEAADERLFAALAGKWRSLSQQPGDRWFQPARDAAALRMLTRMGGAGLPPEVMTRLWRSLCGDAMAARGLKTVHVAGGDMVMSMEGARGYFGFGPVLTPAADVREALERAAESPDVLACVTWPEHAGSGQWWPMLNENRFRELAMLDAWPGDPADPSSMPRMAVVGQAPLESSGDDDTFALAHDDRHEADACMTEVGLAGEVLARVRSLALIRFREFVASDDRRLGMAVRAGLDGLRIVGVRPRP